MILSTSSATATAFVTALLSHCSHFTHILQTHAFMIPRALDHDCLLLCKLIHACTSLHLSHYAFSLFTHHHQSHPPHIYLFNAIINLLSYSHFPPSALFLFNQIQPSGLRPDSYSFPFALKAVARLSSIKLATQIHRQSIGVGLDSHVRVVTALIQAYASSGSLTDARKLFDGVRFRDVALWNAMVAAYVKVGDLDTAMGLFELMPLRNVISWTAVIAGYAQNNRPHDAIAVFRRMLLENVVKPDEVAMLALLSACADLGALELGGWIHNYIDKHRLCKTVPLCNALIDMYAKSGNIRKALQVFENVKNKSVITWTTIIAGLALHGLGKEALEMFARMERAGVQPNEVSFIAILSACSHVGLVEMGHFYFNTMGSRYGIEPKIEHYGCMIDLLGRAGFLQEALELVRGMPFEANAAIWGSLLAASSARGDVEIGEYALQHLVKLEPHSSGNYALLSNIYASLGRWSESGMVRKVMRDTGIKKMPGASFIEVNNRVHEFIVGETSHPEFKRIHEILCKINDQLKIAESLQKEFNWLLEFDEG